MDARLNLKWLISIVPRGRGNAVAQICNENHIAVQLLAQARGTASSDIQLVLGLGEPGKDMVMSLVPGAVLPRLLPALREQLVDYDLIKREVEQLRQAWEIKEEFPDRQIVNANVIGRDPMEKYYAFTIDKGSRHGIEVKDCVITAAGIVGRVIEVGPNYAKVATILDPSVSVGCMVSRTGDIGLVGGDGELAMEKLCAMTLLPRDTLAAAGDEVITTGEGGVFPKQLAVGTVREVYLEPSGKSMVAVIEPYEDIESVRTVMVITEFTE